MLSSAVATMVSAIAPSMMREGIVTQPSVARCDGDGMARR